MTTAHRTDCLSNSARRDRLLVTSLHWLLKAGWMCLMFVLLGCGNPEQRPIWLFGYYVSTDLRFGIEHRPMGDIEASTTGSLMCLDSLGNFRWLTQTIYRTGPSDESLGFGHEEGIVREGTWCFRDSQIVISHRVVYRHTPILGEPTPGPMQVDTFSLGRGTTGVLLENPQYGFVRTERIDAETRRLLAPNLDH
jgi:hypothetical protein